jgi:hypothetical protein
MSKFLFLLDSIDGYEFNPIPIQINFGVIKIPNEEITDDFGINTTEVTVLGKQMDEVLDEMQKKFNSYFNKIGKLKESDFRPMDYDTRQARARIKRHVKNEPS